MHISTQTSIITNGTIMKSQPQLNENHIGTSVSLVQDDADAKKDTGAPCIDFAGWIVLLKERRPHGIRNGSNREDGERLPIM